MEESGIGGYATEDVEEDVGGVSVVWETCGGVEELEGGGEVFLRVEEFEKTVGRERFGKFHHFAAETSSKLKDALLS
jgi:hypothetical protein